MQGVCTSGKRKTKSLSQRMSRLLTSRRAKKAKSFRAKMLVPGASFLLGNFVTQLVGLICRIHCCARLHTRKKKRERSFHSLPRAPGSESASFARRMQKRVWWWSECDMAGYALRGVGILLCLVLTLSQDQKQNRHTNDVLCLCDDVTKPRTASVVRTDIPMRHVTNSTTRSLTPFLSS